MLTPVEEQAIVRMLQNLILEYINVLVAAVLRQAEEQLMPKFLYYERRRLVRLLNRRLRAQT